jgi:hypothetical protein
VEQINPDAGNLGGKVGFIFLGTGLFAAIGGWYLYPETKGISFERLDELYALGVKPRHFKRKAQEAGTNHIVDPDLKAGEVVEINHLEATLDKA